MRDQTAQLRARALRRQPTDAERCLWKHLRLRQLAGQRFRRQVPIGPFIADFACIEARLVIELDGSQHMANAAYDADRTAVLERRGYRVLRFWDNQVLKQTQDVLAEIERVVAEPSPSP